MVLITFDLQGTPMPHNGKARDIVARTPEAWDTWLEIGWRDTERQIRLEIQLAIITAEEFGHAAPHCSWLGLKTADHMGRISVSTRFPFHEELERLEGPMTYEQYLHRFSPSPWFMVDVECRKKDLSGNPEPEELLARLRDNTRFDEYRSEDEGSIDLVRGFKGSAEAASWIAEIGLALKISPYPDQWPIEGVRWAEYVIHGREYWLNKPGYSSRRDLYS